MSKLAAAFRAVFLCLGLAACAQAAGEAVETVAPSVPAGEVPAACMPRGEFLALLAARWREVTVWRGVATGGALVDLVLAANGGTWTILVTRPGGLACMTASGAGWENGVVKGDADIKDRERGI